MGARGNSGVILSQIVRGACEALAETDDLTRVFRSASDAAYRAVKKPVEGTMLTAIRAMADAAEQGGDLTAILARGDETVTATQAMLPILTEAGVVDAGAAGLVEIVRGVEAALSGRVLAPPVEHQGLALDAIHQELSRYRYCTVFVVEGEHLDSDELERELEQLGDSLLVVGDRTALKVHVHTDDPGRALSLGTTRGVIGGIEIANMHAQTQQREERLLHSVPESDPAACAVVVVTAGGGNRALAESLGAAVVDGGTTMNPSTSDLLAAIIRAHAAEVVVLPNNGNVIMSAEQAAANAAKVVRVVPTRSIQAGLAALVSFDPTVGADANVEALQETLAGVVTGAVTIASRDVQLNGVAVQAGKWLGLAEGEAVAGGETFDEAARAVLETLLREPRSVLTLLTGAEAPALDGLIADLRASHPDLELDVHDGGQPHYPLLLAAE
jgi:uncharacterized protein